MQTQNTSITFGAELLTQSALTVKTVDGAQSAMTQLSLLEDKVIRARSSVGASMSRASAASAVLSSRELGLHEAISRIRDADIATEIAHSTRLKILEDMGTAILAQANQQSNLALALLEVNE